MPRSIATRSAWASVDGKRVHGWISVPKSKGPFPAILTVPYAGVYGIEPDSHARSALSMNIIVHDLPVDEKPEFYRAGRRPAPGLPQHRHERPSKELFPPCDLGMPPSR